MVVLQLAAGLAALLVGGELMVRGAMALASAAGVRPLVVGLTVVAAATSAPELGVSLAGAVSGHAAIATGTVLGSSVANVLLVMGVPALVAGAQPVPPTGRQVALLAVASIACAALLAGGTLWRWEGAGMVVGLAGYGWQSLRDARAHATRTAGTTPVRHQVPAALALAAAGLALLWAGADWLVPAAAQIAGAAGVGEETIGAFVLGPGTSLPELATAVLAARRGAGELAMGSVIGANVVNLLGVLGVTALVTPIQTGASEFDALAAAAVVAPLACLAAMGRTMNRTEGALALLTYAAYAIAHWQGVPERLMQLG